MDDGSKTRSTVLGAMGGAGLATTMALGSAGAGAKAGSIAGALAGPVGVAAGAVVGGVAGFASYWVAKGISSLLNDEEVIVVHQTGNQDNQRNDGNDRSDRDRDDEKQDKDGDRDDDREDESSGSEEEPEEESTESSDYETYLRDILDRIERLPRDAPLETRISLFQDLGESLNPIFFDVQNRVRIDRFDRDLIIHIPGFRNIRLSTILRDNLRLFDIDDIGRHLDIVDEAQALIYLLRCRHCPSNYVGYSTQFPNRQSTHRSNVRRGTNSSTNQHLNNHCRETGSPLTFENSFDVIFLRGLPTLCNDVLPNKQIKKILRSWEVFLQWLFKGRVHDGGIGKR